VTHLFTGFSLSLLGHSSVADRSRIVTRDGTKDALSWPRPNYVNPQSRQPLLLGTEIFLGILVTGFVFLRVYMRRKKSALGLDDWTMFAAWVCVLSCISSSHNTDRFSAARHNTDYIELPVSTIWDRAPHLGYPEQRNSWAHLTKGSSL
jgi:hypothetical protein